MLSWIRKRLRPFHAPHDTPPYRPWLTPLEDRLVLSPPGGGWQLQWADEFNGTTLDTSRWRIYTGPRRDAINTASAISVGGGNLTITTYTSNGTHYTGFIGTDIGFLGTYGYWEARIKFQDSPGMWSAFWDQSPTMGNPIGNPGLAGTEIDTMEHRVHDSTDHDISNKGQSTIHWDGYGTYHQSVSSGLVNNPSSPSLQGNFHLYAFQWSPDRYQFYIDGIQIWSTTQAVSQRSEFIYLTSEVQNNSWAGHIPTGGYGSLASSQTKMIVDYVRVYEQVPNDWTSADIGNPTLLGSASYIAASGIWTLAGGGTDIWGTADQFHFASEHFTGDGSLTAQVKNVNNTNSWAKAGVMFRDSTDPGAPFADVLATPGQGVSFQWRTTAGGMADSLTVPGVTTPVWVQLVRAGGTFSAAYSTDGANWTPIGAPQTIAINSTALAGLAVTSHNVNASTSAAFAHVSVLPGTWSAADVGGPGLSGSSVLDPAAGTWTVTGGGADIWNTADQFQFAFEDFTGDASLTARVTAVPNTNAWAKAGLMFRDSTDPGAPFADVLATPGNGVAFQWRDTPGGQPNNVNVTGPAAPVWVQLVRAGDTFSAFFSTDDVNWTQIGATQTVVMNPTAEAGLAVTAHNNASLCAATFTNVSLLPAGWADGDIGNPGRPGFADFDTGSGTWTLAGGGADIWGTADQFHFAYQGFTGDGSLTARVTGVQNTDPWAKAGLMFRDGSDPSAPFADVLATSGNGVSFEWRSVAGGTASSVTVPGIVAPVWVQLVRAGDTFTAAYSTDGANWAPVGDPQTVVMSPTLLTGLAVTAHNNGLLNTATFDNVSFTSPSSAASGFNQGALVGSTLSKPTGGYPWAWFGQPLPPQEAGGGASAASAQDPTPALPVGDFSAPVHARLETVADFPELTVLPIELLEQPSLFGLPLSP